MEILLKGARRFSLLVFFIFVVPVSSATASTVEQQMVFAEQIIDEIIALETLTLNSGIFHKHSKKLNNRLKAVKYKLNKGVTELQKNKKNKKNKSKKHFKKAKHFINHYLKILSKKHKQKNKHKHDRIDPTVNVLLSTAAKSIKKQIQQLINGQIGNQTPVANAGLDQSVESGQMVTLDGSTSSDPDSDALAYSWTINSQPAGSNIELKADYSVTPFFIPMIPGVYSIQLVVTDLEISSLPDSVIINVSAGNTLPLADAGVDQTASVGDNITLDGTGSNDVDGDSLAFNWSLTTKPLGSAAQLSDFTTIMPTFTVDLAGLYLAELTVHDGLVNSGADIVSINVEDLNTLPLANAGPDQSVLSQQLVSLSGSGSSDVDGDPLSWFWTIISKPLGSRALLNDEVVANPSFVTDLEGQYIVQLVVNDGQDDSTPDSVIINAATPNSIPMANSGPDQTDFVGSLITLDGSASSDADGDALSHYWSLTALPVGSNAILGDSTIENPTLILDASGDYVAQLIVNDGQANSTPDEVIITTLNSRPVADAGFDLVNTIDQITQLNGADSIDADLDPLSWQWSIISQPEGSTSRLSGALIVNPSFAADQIGFYLFQLIVSDGLLDSVPSTVSLQVNPVENLAISLDVPQDQLITNQPTLNFSGSLNHLATLTLNSQAVILQSDLSFDHTVTLQDGLNVFTLQATDAINDQVTLTREITLDTSIPVIPNLGFITVSVPDVNGLVTISGLAGSVEPFSEVVIVNLRTDEILILTADGNGAFSAQMSGKQGDTYSLLSQDAANNQSAHIETDDGTLPDDPASVAPALNPMRSNSLFESTSFLYSGPNPIQTGVAPDTIVSRRAAVIRGRVLDKLNDPLPGVTITIKDHPEFGQTLSRSDGMFDMAVNGGGQYTVDYQKQDYLPVQRYVKTDWRDYSWLDDVVMLTLDPKVTSINLLNTAPIQVAQGSTVTDKDGTRTATVMIPQGTSASMVLPDGSTQTLTNLSIRFTEYTVGDNGPESMAAPLPSMSGYTYALEISVDEAMNSGAVKVAGREVQFNQDVSFYVDNFLNLPVGTVVPVGFYDRDIGGWRPSRNGIIMEIISINNGMATIDLDGNGVAATVDLLNDYSITEAERAKLAEMYPVGKSLWRAQTDHFSFADLNFRFFFPVGSAAPDNDHSTGHTKNNNPDCGTANGCIINSMYQTLGESESITGTNFDLHYQSDRTKGYAPNRTIYIKVTDESPPSSLNGVNVYVDILGQRFSKSFSSAPNQTYEYIWDGLDGYGRVHNTNAIANVIVSYRYTPQYVTSGSPPRNRLGTSFNDFVRASNTGLKASIIGTGRFEIGMDSYKQYVLAGETIDSDGLGRWSITPHHALDLVSKDILLGNGTIIRGSELGDTIEKIAGGVVRFTDPIGQLMSEAFVPDQLANIVTSADGGFYLLYYHQIFKVDAEGLITHVIGNGSPGFSGDGGLASVAQINLNSGADGAEHPDGSFYFIDNSNHRIRKVDSSGIITTISGDGTIDFKSGLGGLAVDASLSYPSNMEITEDGSIYFVTQSISGSIFGNYYILKIDPNGVLRVVAGTGSYDTTGDNGSALDAAVSLVNDMVIDKDGNIYFSTGFGLIRKIDRTGVITTISGRGTQSPANGVAFSDIRFDYNSGVYLALDEDENLIVTSSRFPSQIYKVIQGKLVLIAGVDHVDRGSLLEDDKPAQNIAIGRATRTTMLSDKTIAFILGSSRSAYRVVPPFQYKGIAASYSLASKDGLELYNFDASGKHLNTRNTLTGTDLYTFSYDIYGNLHTIIDMNNDITTINRDALGNPVDITSEDGHVTVLSLDQSGYLKSIQNPLGDSIQMTYSTDGLMGTYTDKNNHTNQFQYLQGRLIDDLNPLSGGWTLSKTSQVSGHDVSLSSKMGRNTVFKMDQSVEDKQIFTTIKPDNSQIIKNILQNYKFNTI